MHVLFSYKLLTFICAKNNQETNEAVVVSKELEKENENKKKRKVRKLARKLILDPSTEALE